MLKNSAFYFEKQKSFIPKNIFYKNKKALFTDPIFSEGFDFPYHQKAAFENLALYILHDE